MLSISRNETHQSETDKNAGQTGLLASHLQSMANSRQYEKNVSPRMHSLAEGVRARVMHGSVKED